MRTSKRILVLFIALIMIFSSMQGGMITAFAADEPGIENDGGNEILAPPEEGEEATDVAVESVSETPSEAIEGTQDTIVSEMVEDATEPTEPFELSEEATDSVDVTTEADEEFDESEATEPTESTEPEEPTEATGCMYGLRLRKANGRTDRSICET